MNTTILAAGIAFACATMQGQSLRYPPAAVPDTPESARLRQIEDLDKTAQSLKNQLEQMDVEAAERRKQALLEGHRQTTQRLRHAETDWLTRAAAHNADHKSVTEAANILRLSRIDLELAEFQVHTAIEKATLARNYTPDQIRRVQANLQSVETMLHTLRSLQQEQDKQHASQQDYREFSNIQQQMHGSAPVSAATTAPKVDVGKGGGTANTRKQ
jgi:hypothetical protein